MANTQQNMVSDTAVLGNLTSPAAGPELLESLSARSASVGQAGPSSEH